MTPNSLDQRIASNVRAHMKGQGLSQENLAAHLGRAQDFIYRRLNCKVAFNIRELEAIASVLDVPLTDLVGDSASA